MIAEQHQVPNANTLSDAEYRAAKAEILRRVDSTRLRQHDAADLARVTAKHAPKQET